MDPSDTSVILFPGDGHQHAGMAKGMISCPSARDLFEMANEMLGLVRCVCRCCVNLALIVCVFQCV